ncbi:3-dehydrosphinganine reductase [Homalodisca vitripennis]|nr:3-dehydrosphinganine reductase [Homalodisca vitripennis]
MREWDIPFDELKMGEPIGTGHFGTVYRGNWHGDVAIKVLNMNYMDDDKTFEAFKLEDHIEEEEEFEFIPTVICTVIIMIQSLERLATFISSVASESTFNYKCLICIQIKVQLFQLGCSLWHS